MSNPNETILQLIDRLGLNLLESGGAVAGSMGDTLVTLTVLSVEPLSLLFALSINQDTSDVEIKPPPEAGFLPQACRINFENGRCWLSLYEVTDHSAEQIADLVAQVHQRLLDANLSVKPGCFRCGSLNDARVMSIEGRATRICTWCLDQAIAEKKEREAQLNETSYFSLLGLPAAMLICAGCWAVFWYTTELILDWMKVDVIDMNQLTMMFLLIIACVVGGLIGIPLGKTLRNSGVVRFAPVPLTLVITIGSLVAGEIGYVAIALFHRFGIFDLALAAQLSWRIVANDTGFRIASKVLFGGAIISCCLGEATQRKSERLNV